MLSDPDYEPEFYKEQNEKMIERYSQLFKVWKVDWNKYFNYVKYKLKDKDYWLWSYLCGFEKFVQEDGWKEKDRNTRLYKDADSRIWRILGDYYKNQEYLKSL